MGLVIVIKLLLEKIFNILCASEIKSERFDLYFLRIFSGMAELKSYN